MYTITELNSKTQPELKVIAESMGLKTSDSESFDDIVYKILDQQAIDSAKSQANAPKKKAPKAKTPKTKKQTAKKTEDKKSDNDADSSATADNVKAETKNKPKKQSKNNADAEVLQATSEPESALPKDNPATASSPAPKREKRKRIAKIETAEGEDSKPTIEPLEAPAEVAAESSPTPVDTEVPALEQPTTVDNGNNEQNETTQSATAREINDTAIEQEPRKPSFSLDSFFNTGSRKTFKPRSQQEREEAARRAAEEARRAAEEAAKAPIIIQEPKAEPETNTQAQQNGKRSKRNKNAKQAPQAPVPADVMMPEEPYNFEGILHGIGVLEVMPDGYGFLRSSDYNYLT